MFALSVACSDYAPSIDDRSEIRSSFASDGVPLLRQPKDDVRVQHPSFRSPIHESFALEGSDSCASLHVPVGNAGNNLPSAFPRLSHVHHPEIVAALANRTPSHPGALYQEQLASRHPRANYRRLGSSSGHSQENMVNPTSTARGSNAILSGPVFGPAKEASSSTDARTSDASDLEPSLRHLKDLVVELYIDQERFREINPQFVFNHYTRGDQLSETAPESSASGGAEISPHVPSTFMPSVMFPGGIAEYRLIETQSWCFHYSCTYSAAHVTQW
ncbi:hypothetical protein BS47DRAFT_259256 [Hydnum rufescens UP504]|uniref:Uncharacterized protein n=1 Tax=Hydnum rufescens UP504 TaxID=1448309 RepID=A0A9P6B685_9AGAM|nr:hypothetical protein BS47DRAFT_259256 [Hydnum rufescens UP504]